MTWVYVPETVSAFAQGVEALIWASCSQSRDTTPAAMSSGRNIPETCLLPHSAPDTWPQPRYGQTSPPLTPSPLPVPLTPSAQDTPASPSARPESGLERMTKDTSGPTSPASSPNLATTLNGSSLKMSLATSALALKPCCEPYGTWVSRLRLASSQRQKLARSTSGNGYSSWPTSRAEDAESARMRHSRGVADTLTAVAAQWPTATANMMTGEGTSGRDGAPNLQSAAGLWQTPVADDKVDRERGKMNSRGEPKLSAQAILWPTPMAGTPAQNGNAAAGNSDFSRKAEELADQMWTTPTAHDQRKRGAGQTEGMTNGAGNRCLATDSERWTTPSATDGRRGGTMTDAMSGSSLTQLVGSWPTPASRDHKGSSPDCITRQDGKSRMDMLDFRGEQGFSRPDQTMPTPGPLSFDQLRIARRLWRAKMPLPPASVQRPWSAPTMRPHWSQARQEWMMRNSWQRWKGGRAMWWEKRRLSPSFVSWLMGWPEGHALCACSEMEWSQFRQRMRGALLALPMASGPWIWKPPAPLKRWSDGMTQGDLFC